MIILSPTDKDLNLRRIVLNPSFQRVSAYQNFYKVGDLIMFGPKFSDSNLICSTLLFNVLWI